MEEQANRISLRVLQKETEEEEQRRMKAGEAEDTGDTACHGRSSKLSVATAWGSTYKHLESDYANTGPCQYS